MKNDTQTLTSRSAAVSFNSDRATVVPRRDHGKSHTGTHHCRSGSVRCRMELSDWELLPM